MVSEVRAKNKELAKAEAEARKAKRGLWADPNPIPPWEWRQKKREKEKKARSDVDTGYWLNTKMMYTHVLSRAGRRVRSLADGLMRPHQEQ